jgi:hypothetical protein
MAGWLSYHVQLGDLPTWLAAIGGLVAATFAFGQLKALRTQNANQQRDLDQQAEELAEVKERQRKQAELLDLDIRERRSSQAKGIVVTRVVDEWSPPGGAVENGYAAILRVTNRSHGTISNLDAFFAFGTEVPQRALYSAPPRELHKVAGGWTMREPANVGSVPVTVLDVDQTVDLIGPVRDRPQAEATLGEVRFTDADGRYWRVDHVGKLGEVGTEEPT